MSTTSNNSKDNSKHLQEEIDLLKAEKFRLEKELKSREEMMNNLLAYIQSTEKGVKP